MFEYSFVPSGRTQRPLLVAGVSVGEALLVAIVAIAPLYFVQTLPERGLLNALILPPVPVAPPAPAPVLVVKRPPRTRPRQMFNSDALVSPVVIPKVVAMIDEAPPEIDTGGVPGGMPGVAVAGHGTGLFNNGLSLAPPPPPPPPPPRVVAATPPPPPAVPKRIRVGGDIQAALLLHKIQPVYPLLALQARISGTVVLVAVIGTDGTIKNLTTVSGHPFLVEAAMKAVQGWIYRPTFLNGEPVEVVAEIKVHFDPRGD